MKTFNFILLATILVLTGCRSSDSNSMKYDLQGEITGIDTGRIVLSYWTGTKSIFDTTLIKKGKFSFAGSISEPMRCQLTFDNKLIGFFIEPQKMLIKLNKESKTQDESSMIEKLIKPLAEKISSLRKAIVNIEDSISKITINSDIMSLQAKADQIENSIQKTKNQIDSLKRPEIYL